MAKNIDKLFSGLNLNGKITFLSELIQAKDKDLKVLGLSLIDFNTLPAFLNEVKALSYHYLPEVRESALMALRFAPRDELSEILRDSLQDADLKVLRVAAYLFHREESAVDFLSTVRQAA